MGAVGRRGARSKVPGGSASPPVARVKDKRQCRQCLCAPRRSCWMEGELLEEQEATLLEEEERFVEEKAEKETQKELLRQASSLAHP